MERTGHDWWLWNFSPLNGSIIARMGDEFIIWEN